MRNYPKYNSEQEKTMSESDKPGTGSHITKVSPKKRLKAEWRKAETRQSLKAWARSLNMDDNLELAEHADTWLANK
jgi:hypothetical protein